MSMLLSEAATAAEVDLYGLVSVSPATARWFRCGVGRLAAHCRAVEVDQVTPAHVAAWIEAERRGRAAAVTINSYLRAVRTVYARLMRRGLVEGNPAAAVPFLREPAPRPKAIALSDYMAMRGAATCARDRAIVDVLWASGCRLGGLLSMRVDQIESWQTADGRTCYALWVIEKGDRPRWVYVGRDRLQGDGLREWLSERPATDDPALFVTLAGRPRAMSPSTVEGVIRRLRIAAGVEGRPAYAHAFRHAFALRMLDQGEDLAAVSTWLGHSAPAFTAARYAIRPEAELRRKFFEARHEH